MIDLEKYRFILNVSKPTRYSGGEENEVIKDESKDLFRVVICFPDIYDIGMSNLGLQILYRTLNNEEEIWAERAFMPWVDMEEELLKRGLPLFSLESGRPINQFELVGFSLHYELNYSNILRMLYLSKIPLKSEERNEDDPIIIAGGISTLNPEPLAKIIDAFYIGEGEEGFIEICKNLKKSREKKRIERLFRLLDVEGMYVPSLYEETNYKGRIIIYRPKFESVPHKVKKRVYLDFDKFENLKPLIPPHQVIHDRYPIEISRGCTAGCRFCQAGFFYRPLRHKNPEKILNDMFFSNKELGYEEVGLLSLNSGDYPNISNLLYSIKDYAEKENLQISLPSLRVSSINEELLKRFHGRRKSSFTIAVEAATERLRKVINKRLSDEEIFNTIELLFKANITNLKLYFIIGLPHEKEEDIEAIVNLANKITDMGKSYKSKKVKVTISTSVFVPKPFTPFQWERFENLENILKKQSYLKKNLKKPIEYKWHDLYASALEAIFSRGDRRLNNVLITASEKGIKLDGWAEFFNIEKWFYALNQNSLNFESLLYQEFDEKDPLPWDFIDIGVSKNFLINEKRKADLGLETESCYRNVCHNCGKVKNMCLKVKHFEEKFIPKIPYEIYEEKVYSYRAKFKKEGKAILLGHLDTIRNLVKGFKKSGVILKYSKGFHPFPSIEVASPLPLGVIGEEELLDFECYHKLDESIIKTLNKNIIDGLKFLEIKEKEANDINLNLYKKHTYEIKVLKDYEEEVDFNNFLKILEEQKSRFPNKILSIKNENSKITIVLLDGGIFKILSEVLETKSLREKLVVIRKKIEPYKLTSQF